MSVWYRYDFTCYASPLDEWERPCGRGTVEVHVTEYEVLKETPKGVWLDTGFGEKRFVLRDSKRQWASPTVEVAKEKFIRRKLRHISILEAQIYDIRRALAKAGCVEPNVRQVIGLLV